MNTFISNINPNYKQSALALALLALCVFSPAYAGEVCDLIDGDPNVETDGGSTASGDIATACGLNSQATGTGSVALGNINFAIGDTATAVGTLNTADGTFSSAIGNGNRAAGLRSSALGNLNEATGESSAAVGNFNQSEGLGSVAMGNNSIAYGDHSLALGTLYDADGDGVADISTIADARFGIAIGPGAQVFGDESVALGAGAMANTAGGVALGSGSIADRGNAVSVGSAGNERQITNVAAGTQATDAANVGQMQAGDAQALTSASAYTDQRVNVVGALSAALSLAVPDGRVSGANQFSMGVGTFRDRQAVSIGYSRLVAPRASVRVAAAFADGENAAGVGFNLGW